MTIKYICACCGTKQRTRLIESMLQAGFELHHIECKECGVSRLNVVESDNKPGMKIGKYSYDGLVFNTLIFDSVALANAFMKFDSDWGVISKTDSPLIHLARLDDKGEHT